MENKDLTEENLKREEEQTPVSLAEENLNQSLTNEQKIEYLSKLIQDVEKNIESKGIGKNSF